MIALALLLSPAGISAAQFPAGVSAKLDDLAGESRPLSHVLSYLNEADGPKIDLGTVASIWTTMDGTGLKGETAAVFKRTRVDIQEGTSTSGEMVALDHQRRPSHSPYDKFQVDKINIKLSTPYLQSLPAVSKAVREECEKLTHSALFENVSPDMRISPDQNRDFLWRNSVGSPEAVDCVEEVLRGMLGKFDWTQGVSYRTVRDLENSVVSRDLCAGESYFSQNSWLAPSLPFNPWDQGLHALIRMVLHGKNAFRDQDTYGNFVAVELIGTPNNSVGPKNFTLIHNYPESLDGVRQGRNPDGTFPDPDPRFTENLSIRGGRSFPYCNCMMTDLEEGVMIERHIAHAGVAFPHYAIIRKVRQYNQDFLRIWQEQSDGVCNHLG